MGIVAFIISFGSDRGVPTSSRFFARFSVSSGPTEPENRYVGLRVASPFDETIPRKVAAQ